MNREKFTNLFAVLSRYCSKPKNTELENFCTELLAWCLRNSPTFRCRFLALTGSSALKSNDPTLAIDIDTQRRFELGSQGTVNESTSAAEETAETASENRVVI